jgi:EAL domain-containing protein (putative c-di-GMP-specific phosphodiesterase class I)
MNIKSMDNFTPHFQPIVDVPSGRIRGYEALARQQLDSGEIISCGPYFADPNTNKSFLLQMDRTVRKQAISAISKMPDNTFLTLNISPEWIDLLSLADPIPTIDMIRKFNIDPKRIIIEITETDGMRIAIDDFGAGYSELGRLIALEPDLIKLDMRFFKSAVDVGIAHDAVRAIGFMAERIGCDIICEGVENPKEFNFAVECGATMIQGFLFYKATPDFIPPEDPKPLVRKLQKECLLKKIDAEKEHAKYYRSILQYAYHLRETVSQHTDIKLDMLPKMPNGFIRFYICNLEGEQLSPNYDFFHQCWYEDTHSIGSNWSGRPYLYQVLAHGDMALRNEMTTRPYRDRITRELFQTISLKIDGDTILLIDYQLQH